MTLSRLTCGTGSGDGSQPGERNVSHGAADESEGGRPLRPGTIRHIVSSDLRRRQTSVCSALQIAFGSTHSAHSPDRVATTQESNGVSFLRCSLSYTGTAVGHRAYSLGACPNYALAETRSHCWSYATVLGRDNAIDAKVVAVCIRACRHHRDARMGVLLSVARVESD